jgi:hypothetical protein
VSGSYRAVGILSSRNLSVAASTVTPWIGSTAAATANFTVGDEQMVGVTFFELDGSLISRVTDFWPEPYEPPAGREHLVERLPGEVDSFSVS